jgi:hypothetical protein
MPTLRTAAVLFAFTVLAGCTPSPEKVCAKRSELAVKGGGAAPSIQDTEACRASVASLKKSSPDTYSCVAKCSSKADSTKDLNACSKECPRPSAEPAGTAAGPSIEDTVSAYEKRADALTLDTVESNLRAAYAPNFTVVERKDSAGVLRVVIANKNNASAPMLAATLVLVKGSSKAEVSKLMEDVKRGSRQAITIAATGSKKGLLAKCDMERRPNDVPKPCGGYSGELDSLAAKAGGPAL